ncbi:hypothetical protein [Dechloromonas denitrificans]|uniref:hypothetical protein n=1 Tax=Dechloromonas denitrificans TaxID=281362 RepID=UPI001CF9AC76|nr:hypothetical protein [Dechloromonas denitrificans]UCV09411.1 hypothetical protein KI615_07815 [Dechloromonas denitrificans]
MKPQTPSATCSPAINLGKSRKNRQAERPPAWGSHLPDEWLDAVDAPLYFAQYSEYEISADRTVGYDADDQACFTAYRFELTELASDDDEEFYQVVTYSEELAAWRLRDERWLVYRRTSASDRRSPRGFYAFSQTMPR